MPPRASRRQALRARRFARSPSSSSSSRTDASSSPSWPQRWRAAVTMSCMPRPRRRRSAVASDVRDALELVVRQAVARLLILPANIARRRDHEHLAELLANLRARRLRPDTPSTNADGHERDEGRAENVVERRHLEDIHGAGACDPETWGAESSKLFKQRRAALAPRHHDAGVSGARTCRSLCI